MVVVFLGILLVAQVWNCPQSMEVKYWSLLLLDTFQPFDTLFPQPYSTSMNTQYTSIGILALTDRGLHLKKPDEMPQITFILLYLWAFSAWPVWQKCYKMKLISVYQWDSCGHGSMRCVCVIRRIELTFFQASQMWHYHRRKWNVIHYAHESETFPLYVSLARPATIDWIFTSYSHYMRLSQNRQNIRYDILNAVVLTNGG